MGITIGLIAAVFVQIINNWLNWPIIFLVLLSDRMSKTTLLLTGFATGLLTDLLIGNRLGVLALGNVLSLGIILVLSTRISFNWVWKIAVIFVFEICYAYAWPLLF